MCLCQSATQSGAGEQRPGRPGEGRVQPPVRPRGDQGQPVLPLRLLCQLHRRPGHRWLWLVSLKTFITATTRCEKVEMWILNI